MSIPVPHHVQTLKPYVPGKPIEETEREYGVSNVVKLASNENPLGPSPKAMRALAEALPKMHLYPDASGYYLRRRLAAHLSVSPEEIVLGSGSNEIIELLIRTFMTDADLAMVSQGSFLMYKVALQAHGRRFVEVPHRAYRYDLDAMAERADDRTRLIFLANPDNPTGTWFGREAFERFLKAATRRAPQALIVMDEAYYEFATASDYPDSLRYRRDWPNVVTLRTFSKAYGLAGLRLGYGVFPAELAGYLNRVRMPFNVTTAAQIAGLAALDDQEHVEKTRALNTAGLERLLAELPKLGVEALPSQGNFVFVDLKRPAAAVNEALLRRGVITRPVPNYGFPNALRISVGTAPENERLLSALREALSER